MKTIDDLERQTKEFLGLHSPRDWSIAEWPKWEKYEKHPSGQFQTFVATIPNHDKRGCYALFKESEVVYIGLGASINAGRYEGHGIGKRLMAHVVTWDRNHPASCAKERRFALREKWRNKGITEIFTLGFPEKLGYLSAALEMFLVRNLDPRENLIGKPAEAPGNNLASITSKPKAE